MKSLLPFSVFLLHILFFENSNAQNIFYAQINSFKNINSPGFTYNDELNVGHSKMLKDSNVLNSITINTKQLIQFYAILDNSKFYRQYMYVEPNDTLLITYSEKKMSIISKYQTEIDFWDDMNKKGLDYISLIESKINFSKLSPKNAIDTVNFYFEQRQKFTNELLNKSKNFRPYFRNTVNRFNLLIRDYFLLNIIGEKNSPLENLGLGLVENKELQPLYMDIKKHLSISKSEYQSMPQYYSNTVELYSRYLSYNSLGTDNDYKTIFQTIDKSFMGELKDLALTIHISKKIKSGFENSLFYDYKLKCNNEVYVMSIEKEMNKVIFANKNLLNEKLTDSQGHIITWKDFLLKHSGKITYVDFWASWCEGCKYLVPTTKTIKEEFPEIDFVYISIEDNEIKWKQSIKTWGIEKYYHYYLMPNSKLIELFARPFIPRFSLINKQSEILTTDAPRPSDPTIKEILGQLILK